MDEFPLCGHMVSDEYEQLSSEGESVSTEVNSVLKGWRIPSVPVLAVVNQQREPRPKLLQPGFIKAEASAQSWVGQAGAHVSSSSELCWLSLGVFLS